MIVCAAIVSKSGSIFHSSQHPPGLKADLSKHVNNFLYALSIEDDDLELPYIETTDLRYVYKQTDDLYWLMVTKPESDMFNDIHLLGKFVCTILEYGPSETNSDTLMDEQRELFYRHIWRPWDEETHCFFCSSPTCLDELWGREFENRLQFLTSIRDGHINDDDVHYFNGLIAEAWAVSAKLSPKWSSKFNQESYPSDTDSICSEQSRSLSISEETVIDNCRLKCLLQDIVLTLSRLQDPYLRLFARRDLLISSNSEPENQICSAPSLKEIDADGPEYDSDF